MSQRISEGRRDRRVFPSDRDSNLSHCVLHQFKIVHFTLRCSSIDLSYNTQCSENWALVRGLCILLIIADDKSQTWQNWHKFLQPLLRFTRFISQHRERVRHSPGNESGTLFVHVIWNIKHFSLFSELGYLPSPGWLMGIYMLIF